MGPVTIGCSIRPPLERVCVLNPRTLKSTCGIASTTHIMICSDNRRVVLKVDLDGKAPLSKCFVPAFLVNYLGQLGEVSVPDLIPDLDSVLVEPISYPSDDRSNEIRLPVDHLANSINGWVLSDGEPFMIPFHGRFKSFKITSSQGYGVFLKGFTKIRFKDDAGVSKVEKFMGFNLIGGLGSVIAKLKLVVQKPLNDRRTYLRYGLIPPKGILLYGPPGTGKTLLMKALSEELAEVYITCVKGTDLCGGDVESKIHTLFTESRQRAIEAQKTGLIVFIDEIDSLCPSRDFGITEVERKAVAAMLTEMDGFDAKGSLSETPLIVVGATNRPNSIDIALRRPGRFEFEIEVPPPDSDGRKEILRIFALTRFRAIWAPTESQLAEISGLTHGFVGADLLSLISQSAYHALESGNQILPHASIMNELAHIRPSALREVSVTIPKTKWSDIGGYEDVKEQLKEAVLWPIQYSDHFRALSVEAPGGVLLYGPPGCSKTMMARAVATESSMNFIAVKGPEMFSKWVGESEQAIRDLFRKARLAKPCIIFFDEIDAIASQREGGDGGVSNRVLTQLLTEMDGVSSIKQVIVIAATNRPHVLDPALLRPGRFDRLVYVGLPNATAREAIIRNSIEKIPTSFETPIAQVASQFTERTKGYSGAELVMAVKEAAVHCIRRLVIPASEEDALSERLDELSITPVAVGGRLVHSDLVAGFDKVQPRTDAVLNETLLSFKDRFTLGYSRTIVVDTSQICP